MRLRQCDPNKYKWMNHYKYQFIYDEGAYTKSCYVDFGEM